MQPWGWYSNEEYLCQVCGGACTEIYVCSGCYTYGHQWCLNITMVEGYGFCENCSGWAQAQVQRYRTEQERQRWAERLQGQLVSWRDRTFRTAAVLTTVGVAVGRATVALDTVLSWLLRGSRFTPSRMGRNVTVHAGR